MKTAEFLKTMEGLKFKENLMTYALIGLVLLVLILGSAVASKDPVVTVVPFTLSTEAEIGYDFASTAYLEAFSLYAALALGNVTPETLSFLRERLTPITSPRIYQQTTKALESQVDEIRDSHVTLYFEPRHVNFEPATNKFFIHGQSVMEATTGQRERDEKTYEFIWDVLNFMPSLVHIDTYEGPPRTVEYLAELENKGNKG